MVFDELFPESKSPATMDGVTTRSSAPRSVSPACGQEQATADCHAIPVATPVSPCTSEESDASTIAAISITGKFSDIEEKYYVDSRVLGTGHHGSVRECTDRTTGHRYAVKTICKNDPAVKAGGLVREIKLLREMKHHSIIRLVDVIEDAEFLHLVTDLCKGGELFDKIVEKSSSDNGVPCFEEDEAARILYQILTTVSYMHKKFVTHRDIKPENILFETKGEDSSIKIIDFGLARKHYESLGEPPMNNIVGTPYYIAPEVLRKKYDNSCDLWSVGVIAYILLCGYPPFNGKDKNEIHRSILKGRYCFPSQDWKGTSREARNFIRLLLQIDPSKRMTLTEALEHPWIVKHTRVDASLIETRLEDKLNTDEAVVKGVRMPRRGAMVCGRIARRKYRKAVFGI